MEAVPLVRIDDLINAWFNQILTIEKDDNKMIILDPEKGICVNGKWIDGSGGTLPYYVKHNVLDFLKPEDPLQTATLITDEVIGFNNSMSGLAKNLVNIAGPGGLSMKMEPFGLTLTDGLEVITMRRDEMRELVELYKKVVYLDTDPYTGEFFVLFDNTEKKYVMRSYEDILKAVNLPYYVKPTEIDFDTKLTINKTGIVVSSESEVDKSSNITGDDIVIKDSINAYSKLRPSIATFVDGSNFASIHSGSGIKMFSTDEDTGDLNKVSFSSTKFSMIANKNRIDYSSGNLTLGNDNINVPTTIITKDSITSSNAENERTIITPLETKFINKEKINTSYGIEGIKYENETYPAKNFDISVNKLTTLENMASALLKPDTTAIPSSLKYLGFDPSTKEFDYYNLKDSADKNPYYAKSSEILFNPHSSTTSRQLKINNSTIEVPGKTNLDYIKLDGNYLNIKSENNETYMVSGIMTLHDGQNSIVINSASPGIALNGVRTKANASINAHTITINRINYDYSYIDGEMFISDGINKTLLVSNSLKFTDVDQTQVYGIDGVKYENSTDPSLDFELTLEKLKTLDGTATAPVQPEGGPVPFTKDCVIFTLDPVTSNFNYYSGTEIVKASLPDFISDANIDFDNGDDNDLTSVLANYSHDGIKYKNTGAGLTHKELTLTGSTETENSTLTSQGISEISGLVNKKLITKTEALDKKAQGNDVRTILYNYETNEYLSVPLESGGDSQVTLPVYFETEKIKFPKIMADFDEEDCTKIDSSSIYIPHSEFQNSGFTITGSEGVFSDANSGDNSLISSSELKLNSLYSEVKLDATNGIVGNTGGTNYYKYGPSEAKISIQDSSLYLSPDNVSLIKENGFNAELIKTGLHFSSTITGDENTYVSYLNTGININKYPSINVDLNADKIIELSKLSESTSLGSSLLPTDTFTIKREDNFYSITKEELESFLIKKPIIARVAIENVYTTSNGGAPVNKVNYHVTPTGNFGGVKVIPDSKNRDVTLDFSSKQTFLNTTIEKFGFIVPSSGNPLYAVSISGSDDFLSCVGGICLKPATKIQIDSDPANILEGGQYNIVFASLRVPLGSSNSNFSGQIHFKYIGER